MATILVTGGAGFVGSHLVRELVRCGHKVRVYDSLEPQIHGNLPAPRLPPTVELVVADVCDRTVLRRALDGVEIVFHLAAQVGVGQSMYEVARYVSANSLGAATLLDIIANERQTLPVRKIIVASSMSIYGEGAYHCSVCGVVFPPIRSEQQLAAHQWEMECPRGHGLVGPMATDESKPLQPASVYAITKRDHEELFLCVGRAYRIPTVALRYFNIYGPGQALANPYTGVGAIFCSQLLNKQSPLIFEDGNQLRDFVHISDIVQANLLAMNCPAADYEVFNVGSGAPIRISDLASLLIERLSPGIKSHFFDRYRQGDIRHCYADIGKASRLLGYKPRVTLQAGVGDLVEWVRQQKPDDRQQSRIEQMKLELDARQLTV